ncbi:response regulator receiver domain [Flavobacterium sp.]|uniref:response regulator receiver domain n=1 Tax=Flavobacterium sp. TaxID=239 RepID=UPI0026326314|nr:response regulator receiver domain [Flavobacterium sp.]MDG2431090.1 response regulator receiver domain [Flavobacterium sp.]
MINPFFEKSKEIANSFLQSIVFIDDKAYAGVTLEDPNHDFNAQKVSLAFAKEKKICGVYQPKTKQDIEDFKCITKKADVIILDWKIILLEADIEDPNADDDDDPRGIYTLDIIKNIFLDISKSKESLKLIIVYTGETDLNEITTQIFTELNEIKPGLKKESCKVSSNNTKILIRAKSSVEDDEVDNKFNHIVGLNDKIVKYKDLPNFILDEFTMMTSGLLSNFALLSLATLRQNSSKILGLFSKNLDSAYLSHKALLPSQEDAEDLLIELFGDSISDLLFYNKTNDVIRDIIPDWVEVNINEEVHELLNKIGKGYVPIENFKRSQSLINELLQSPIKDISKRYAETFNKEAGVSKSKMKDSYEHISLSNTVLFLNKEEQINREEIDKKFSKLAHHKSLFIPNDIIPKLTLGTVIKSTTINDKYYICIQQKCDSVRIPYGSERKFLFIPLVLSEAKFDILTPEGLKLKKVKDSFSIRTIKFVCQNDQGVIKAELNEDVGTFIFKQKYEDEYFEWVLDLKDLHSQRIITEYTSQLSRVGLDESEWHRRFLS